MPADTEFEQDDPYDYKWTLAAFEAIKAGTLHRELVRSDGVLVVASVFGDCPHCVDPLRFTLPLAGVISDGGVLGRELVRASKTHLVDVTCGCAVTHPGAPPGVKGCGIAFRVELKEGRDD